MSWYWIVLIVIGYMVMHLITAIVVYKCGMVDKDMAVFPAAFWPIFLPLLIVYVILNKYVK